MTPIRSRRVTINSSKKTRPTGNRSASSTATRRRKVRDSNLLPDDRLAALRAEYAIATGTTYLNHGSFGPPPRAVVAAQQAVRDALNANPMRFFVREWDARFDD